MLVKLEMQNPGGSLKDRIALNMIEAAEKEGKIKPGQTTLVDFTSGNTGKRRERAVAGAAVPHAMRHARLVRDDPTPPRRHTGDGRCRTGIGEAMVAATKGYKCVICMPQVCANVARTPRVAVACHSPIPRHACT